MLVYILFLFIMGASAAPSTSSTRIIGGSVTTINNYPHMATLLLSLDFVNFFHECGGSILNQRNILSAAHCFHDDSINPARWRIRVGSSFAHSGGSVHNVDRIIVYPEYDRPTFKNDIAIMQTSTFINYIDNIVQSGVIAGSAYSLADNEVVWAAGWGYTEHGMLSEQLRHVQIWTINQNICNERYGGMITESMLCTGWLDVGGRDQCQGDSGGPVYHNGIIVGVCSFGNGCASEFFPGVNARVSRFTSWIQATAV